MGFRWHQLSRVRKANEVKKIVLTVDTTDRELKSGLAGPGLGRLLRGRGLRDQEGGWSGSAIDENILKAKEGRHCNREQVRLNGIKRRER